MHLYGQFSLLNELKAILNVGKSVEENPHEAYYARPIMPVSIGLVSSMFWNQGEGKRGIYYSMEGSYVPGPEWSRKYSSLFHLFPRMQALASLGFA